MPPKRKSDAIDLSKDSEDENYTPKSPVTAPAKRARVSNASEVAPGNAEASSSKGKSDLESLKSAPKSWKDIELEGEDEGEVPVYDDCNEIRRKIRLLQKDPNFKITHWLKEIGDINSNSCQRFMKASGANGGASNGTYYAAYVYFEKVRIFEGKKKTAKRERNEIEHPRGFPLRASRGVWILSR
ncbi:unnamed protein product [Somion occarium]|uniref:DUF7726 domain-containing protein n=1 Tax=Somion occarium TaxID=3059160 RepID=A0ABP1CK67_9APHY